VNRFKGKINPLPELGKEKYFITITQKKIHLQEFIGTVIQDKQLPREVSATARESHAQTYKYYQA
jgi:hypothetical protein